MLFNYKIVIVTPAGRRSTMQILEKYVKALKIADLIDRWDIWLNTSNQSDIHYILDLLDHNSDWIKVIDKRGINYGTADNLKNYWPTVCDEDTLYIRFDDDIVFIELEEFVEFVKFRIDHPEYLVVYPTIINNTGIAYHMQQQRLIAPSSPMIGEVVADNGAPEWNRGGFHPCDAKAWADTNYCLEIHKEFIQRLESYQSSILRDPFLKWRLFFPWELKNYETVSINSCSWFGKDFAPFQGQMETKAEEGEITWYLPQKLDKINCVYGKFIIAHYAFYPQKAVLDDAGIDKMYLELADTYIKNFLGRACS